MSRYEISAGGVIYRLVADGEVEVCLIGTHNHRRWALPKGHVEHGESVEACAVREVFEETGILGTYLERLGRHEYEFVHRDADGPVRIHKLVHVCLLKYVSGEPTPELEEVDDARWFPIDEALRVMSYDSERRLVARARGMVNVREGKKPS